MSTHDRTGERPLVLADTLSHVERLPKIDHRTLVFALSEGVQAIPVFPLGLATARVKSADLGDRP